MQSPTNGHLSIITHRRKNLYTHTQTHFNSIHTHISKQLPCKLLSAVRLDYMVQETGAWNLRQLPQAQRHKAAGIYAHRLDTHTHAYTTTYTNQCSVSEYTDTQEGWSERERRIPLKSEHHYAELISKSRVLQVSLLGGYWKTTLRHASLPLTMNPL